MGVNSWDLCPRFLLFPSPALRHIGRHGNGDGHGDPSFRGREFLLRAGGDGAVFLEQMAGGASRRE